MPLITVRQRRLSFLDWMKAAGLTLIVYGHVAAASSVSLTPPVYPKQVGVALFVFATGYTLARETRPGWTVVISRFVKIWLVGLAAALTMSGIGLILWGDPNESNYLPLVGLHLVIDDFPANPTTWYIGTYLHLLVLWALTIRGRTIGSRIVVSAFLSGIVIRVALIREVGSFVAYMSPTNWLDVLLLGVLAGQSPSDRASRLLPLAYVVPVLWPIVSGLADWQPTFPFMTAGAPTFSSTLAVSIGASTVYMGYSWVGYLASLRLPDNRFVSLLARNSVVVFIAHMPVYYLLEYIAGSLALSYTVKVAIEFLVCLVVLAAASELLRHLPRLSRDRIEDAVL